MQAGIQISSFRPLMKTEEEMRRTFLRAAELGCRFVQLQWVDPSIPTEKIAAALKEAGLVSVSVQDFFDSVCADEEYYLRLNGQTGGKWLCVSRIPDRMKSPEGLEAYIRELQRLSETAEARGQTLCFHPVGADYQEIGGKCPVDVLLSRMPKLKLCLDLYHLDKAGYAIPAWIADHAGCIEMVHFKDEKNGLLVPAGQGSVRYGGSVHACLQANVSYGFVEQETWDRDPFVCIGEALAWLRRELSAAQKAVRRGDWKTKPMPEQHETFVLDRSFSDGEMDVLHLGNIPQAMEDKWFRYMEGSTLWAHRSWTGYCIYRIDFRADHHHIVTVNRNPEQYSCTSTDEDIASLNKLLNWWTRTPYDHYNEWLSETYDSLKKAGKL